MSRGDITFQVANLHVYPRHFDLLSDTAIDTDERLARRVWQHEVAEHKFLDQLDEKLLGMDD